MSNDTIQDKPVEIVDEASVVEAVLARFAQTPPPRLREIILSFTTHLHAFAREVRLTEEELEEGIAFLNAVGQTTNDTHNEGILLSDALGLSTLVCLMNNGPAGATEIASALLGPFWRMNSPATPDGGSVVRSETPGDALSVEAQLVDPDGRPIAGVAVDVWQSSPAGLYENQDADQADMNLRGQLSTDEEGRFRFQTVKPAGYPVPTHGPVGALLRAQDRHPYRPAHLHFLAYKPGFKTLISQIFVDDDPYITTDVVFGVTRNLIGDFEADASGKGYHLRHRLVMQPGEAKLPRPPIA